MDSPKSLPKKCDSEYFSTHPIRPVLPSYQNQAKKSQGNFRPISLMNMDAKIFTKIVTNEIQQHMKGVTYHANVWFAQGV